MVLMNMTLWTNHDSADFEPYMCVLECGPMIHIFKPISSVSGVFTLATCNNKHARLVYYIKCFNWKIIISSVTLVCMW